jgi:multidrug efflux pump subunit AcrA (membrane-fusion protein)
MKRCARVAVWLLLVLSAGCQKSEPETKPAMPANLVSITTGQATRSDLSVVESAVGSESALSLALDYDPTRLHAGTVYVRLPFPADIARGIRIGQAVTLTSFAEPERRVKGQVSRILPPLNATTLTRDVIVSVSSSSGFRAGGSVRGEIVMGTRRGAITVPEQALVQRPAGDVVYVMDGDVAREQRVAIGITREGRIEIREGLTGTETVAVDGAALLTDGAKVRIAATGS